MSTRKSISAPSSHVVEESAGAVAQLGLQPRDHARRQTGTDETADAGVARIVHHVEHDPRHFEILEQRPSVGSVAAPLGRIRVGVAEHRERLGVRRHGPEPFGVGCVRGRRVPPHRCLAPVDREQVVREAGREVVEIGEVDLGETRRANGHARRAQLACRTSRVISI